MKKFRISMGDCCKIIEANDYEIALEIFAVEYLGYDSVKAMKRDAVEHRREIIIKDIE